MFSSTCLNPFLSLISSWCHSHFKWCLLSFFTYMCTLALFSLCAFTDNPSSPTTFIHLLPGLFQMKNYWFCVLSHHCINAFQIENVSLTLGGFKQLNERLRIASPYQPQFAWKGLLTLRKTQMPLFSNFYCILVLINILAILV